MQWTERVSCHRFNNDRWGDKDLNKFNNRFKFISKFKSKSKSRFKTHHLLLLALIEIVVLNTVTIDRLVFRTL